MRFLLTLGLGLAGTLSLGTFPRLAVAEPPPAAATTYTVKAGDDCRSIAAQFYGDPERYDLLHDANPQMGPQPHRLAAGTVLNVPPLAPDARLASIHNHVEVEAKERRAGNPNDPLFRGNRVSTGESSNAGVTFRDTSKLYLAERTLVVILGASKDRVAASGTSLVTGALRAHMAALAGKRPLDTPSAAVALGPGKSQVTVDPQKTTRLAVYEGQSAITARAVTVPVDHGFGSKAEQGKAPTPPRPLPPAPAWGPSPPQVAVTSTASGEIHGGYAPGTGVGPAPDTWHVQIAHDDEFEDPITDVTVPEKVRELVAKDVAPGSYFVRVSAIDADKFEGPFGATSRVKVVSVVEVTEGRRVSVTVRPEGTFCAVDGGAFEARSAPFFVDAIRRHKVDCADAADGAGASTVDVAPKKVGARLAAVRIVRTAAGRGTLLFQLRDDTGPLAAAEAALDLGPAHADALTAAATPGEYTASVAWPPGVREVVVRAMLPSGEVAEGTATIPDASSGAPSATASAGPALRFEPSIMVSGSALGEDLTRTGAGAGLGLGARTAVGSFELGVAARGGFELHEREGGGGAGTGTIVTLLTPVSLGVPVGRWLPYVAVAPVVAFDAAAGQGTDALVGGQFALGASLRMKDVTLFVEPAYRVLTIARHPPHDANASGVVAVVGVSIPL